MDWVDDHIQRDRGILTEHDRRYLLDTLDEELSENAEYQKRYQIRKRIENAIQDFHIITNGLSAKDIDLLFEESDKWAVTARRKNEQGRTTAFPEFPESVKAWSAMFEFFAYSQISSNIQESTILLRWVIEEAVERAIRKYGFYQTNEYYEADASVEFRVEKQHRLLEYIEYLDQWVLDQPEAYEEVLEKLHHDGYLPYHLAVYLSQKQRQ